MFPLLVLFTAESVSALETELKLSDYRSWAYLVVMFLRSKKRHSGSNRKQQRSCTPVYL